MTSLLTSFKSRHVKLSIDIFLESECQIFAEFVHFSDTIQIDIRGEGEDREHTLFVFFILQKHKVLLLL